MAQDTHIQIRISETEKKKVQEILSKMGLNFSSAIKLFLHQVKEREGMPFDISIRKPNARKATLKNEFIASAPQSGDTESAWQTLFSSRKIG